MWASLPAAMMAVTFCGGAGNRAAAMPATLPYYKSFAADRLLGRPGQRLLSELRLRIGRRAGVCGGQRHGLVCDLSLGTQPAGDRPVRKEADSLRDGRKSGADRREGWALSDDRHRGTESPGGLSGGFDQENDFGPPVALFYRRQPGGLCGVDAGGIFLQRTVGIGSGAEAPRCGDEAAPVQRGKS